MLYKTFDGTRGTGRSSEKERKRHRTTELHGEIVREEARRDDGTHVIVIMWHFVFYLSCNAKYLLVSSCLFVLADMCVYCHRVTIANQIGKLFLKYIFYRRAHMSAVICRKKHLSENSILMCVLYRQRHTLKQRRI